MIKTFEEFTLNESDMRGRTIVSVDVQPEYARLIDFVPQWADFLNMNSDANDLVFLYNGPSLGMVDEWDYMEWLSMVGVDDAVLDSAEFFDKAYGFFRFCMDEGVDEDEIVRLISYMYRNGVRDTRDMTLDDWDRLGASDYARELLEPGGDSLYVPDLMDYARDLDSVVLCGGGMDECLREVELAFRALGKSYRKLDQFLY